MFFEGVGVLCFIGVVFCVVGVFDVDVFVFASSSSSTTRFLCKLIIFVKMWNLLWIWNGV